MTDQVLERFWDKVQVDKITGCWDWIACKSDGYGRFGIESGKMLLAHRFSYEVNKDKIPDGLQLDHLCRNRKCVNPDHLEIVTQKENIRRGINIQRLRAFCPRGHPYSGNNLVINNRGARICRICRNELSRLGKLRRKGLFKRDTFI